VSLALIDLKMLLLFTHDEYFYKLCLFSSMNSINTFNLGKNNHLTYKAMTLNK
jgi:hypothetical protein